ncbi:MAG: hypothetical protein K9G33_10890, partial [Sneathiella sp.]|nr:hypothetical protein [Sneathiella sp.]
MLIAGENQFMSRLVNNAASAIFIFLAILLIVSRIPISNDFRVPLYVGLSAFAVLLIFFIIGGHKTSFVALISIGGFSAVVIAWAYGTRSLYPPGDDGYIYHIKAVWDLAAGWQPSFSPHNNIWIDSYPSGYWMLQSYVVSITGLLLSGQSLLVGLIVAVALLAYGFFLERVSPQLKRFQRPAALFFAGLVVANPVVMTQVLTHYTDAPLYLFGCALGFFLMSDAFSSNRLARW